jgi:hypothetical protein
MSSIDTETSLREMNEIATRELQNIQQRVEQFQTGLRQQAEIQHRVSATQDVCFDMVRSHSATGIGR